MLDNIPDYWIVAAAVLMAAGWIFILFRFIQVAVVFQARNAARTKALREEIRQAREADAAAAAVSE